MFQHVKVELKVVAEHRRLLKFIAETLTKFTEYAFYIDAKLRLAGGPANRETLNMKAVVVDIFWDRHPLRLYCLS